MSEKTLQRVHLIYGIVLSALLVALAILFGVACVNVFNETGAIGAFTPERISDHFSYVSVLAFTTLACVVVGGVFDIAFPLASKRLKGENDPGVTLKRLYGKLNKISTDAADKIERHRIVRLAMVVASMIFILFAAIGSFVYLSNNFDATNPEINSQVAHGWLCVLYFFIGPFLYLILTAYICRVSVKKELEIVKGEFKKIGMGTKEETVGTFTKVTDGIYATVQRAKEPKDWHKTFGLVFKILLACTIVAFIIIGIVNGGADGVVDKANKICSECIGLG